MYVILPDAPLLNVRCLPGGSIHKLRTLYGPEQCALFPGRRCEGLKAALLP